MLLETLDIKQNDVIIYSQNLFNLEKNFKLILKDDPQKESHKINFSDVCRFINEYTPKNLIVYRLLTNIKNFEIYPSKYGFYTSINGVNELIYFDPIFAVKEIEEYSLNENYPDLRFRIQQLGLTTLNRNNDSVNYAEIYSVDLMATEAKFQNDKVFAQAILAFTNFETSVQDEENTIKPDSVKKPEVHKKEKIKKESELKKKIEKMVESSEKKPKAVPVKEINPLPKIKEDAIHKNGINLISHDISEDKDFDYKQIMKINFKGAASARKLTNSSEEKGRGNIINEVLPKALINEKRQSEFGKFLQRNHANTKGKSGPHEYQKEKEVEMLNIFKSPASINKFLKERERKTVVLKFDKK